jgi:hypothetical protein
VGGRGEPGLGDPDHRDAELGVRMRAQAGPAAGVQIGVAVDHQQAQPARPASPWRAHERVFCAAHSCRPLIVIGGSNELRGMDRRGGGPFGGGV